MAKFFIDRPIFAIVIALLVMLAGGLSILSMPIEQYPTIAPPSIQITATYPGASAQTVENTVVQVIEQQMSGLDHLLYLSSNADDSGQATTTLTFAAGTNPDIAQVQVQNKLQLATPLLPAQVQQAGVRVTKSNNGFLLVAGFVSTDNSMSRYDIANYVVSHLQDPLSRINGVGNFNVFGSQYAMRIWLDTDKLNSFALTPVDVATAIQSQNVQVAGGQLGGTPAPPTQRLTATITEATLLHTPAEFGDILLKVNADGSQVRLSDVARVDLGAESYFLDTRYNGQPACAFAIQLAPGANALATANAMRAPVVPPGTFGVLSAFWFTINTLSMFGLVLAIGLLVDDAIVVVENVERVMTEEHLPPKEATEKAMSQITGALIGVAMVLSAVFVPVAMSSGT